MAKLEVQSDIKPFTMIKSAIIDSENILNEHENQYDSYKQADEAD